MGVQSWESSPGSPVMGVQSWESRPRSLSLIVQPCESCLGKSCESCLWSPTVSWDPALGSPVLGVQPLESSPGSFVSSFLSNPRIQPIIGSPAPGSLSIIAQLRSHARGSSPHTQLKSQENVPSFENRPALGSSVLRVHSSESSPWILFRGFKVPSVRFLSNGFSFVLHRKVSMGRD
jgi:hypothetical protein